MTHLRALEPSDIDAIYRWENDPTTWIYSAAHQPFSRNALQRFINEHDGCDFYTSRQLRLMADIDGIGTVGCVDLFDFDPFHRHAALGLLVDNSHRNKGYGSSILNEVESFAKDNFNLHQLFCDISEENIACLRLFIKNGYNKCGTKKEWIWNSGSWTNAISLQKIIGQ